MKATTEKAVLAFRILYGDSHLGGKNPGARISKMKDGDKFNIVRIMKELKPVAADYDDYIKDAAERLKPEGVEAVQAKIQQKAPLSPDEQTVWAKYNSDVEKCLQEELAKEIEFSFAPLSEEGFKGLLDSNDFTMAEIMALYDVIGQ